MTSPATLMALARGLHLAAMIAFVGTGGFILWMLPAAALVPERLRRRLTLLWCASGLTALLAGLAWFVLQAAAIAGAENLPDGLAALPVVAAHTRYGNVLLVRLALLLAATTLSCFPRRRAIAAFPALIMATAALAMQGVIGHAGATAGPIGDGLVLSEALHLIAAGVWLGALLPLWLSLRALSLPAAAAVCERFSPIGLSCVVVLAGSGFVQGLELIGGVPALFGTRYGHLALLKIGLFLAALILAAVNRLRLTDRLAAGEPGARRGLLAAVALETAVGLAIVGAASFMASSPPAAHTEPVWPFPWRFSLVTVNEDEDFRREVVLSLIAIGLAVGLLMLTLLWRHFRLAALALLAAVAALRGPSLGLLLVQAYPTSFQLSPTGFAATSIVRGQALFGPNCASCHGATGEGNGPAAAALRIKPADLTMPHIWEHSDGEMFWWLTHGVDDPEGGLAMPGFAATLSPDDRWALIDYVRAHNAALGMQRDLAFDVPLRAPALPLQCAGLPASAMSGLRGHAVHVVTEAAVDDGIPPQSGITTVTLDLRDGKPLADGSCVAASAAAWQAYAVLADEPPDNLAGADFLVDPNGWLRAVHRPGSAGGWYTADDLIVAIKGICASPVKAFSGEEHEHHH